MSDQITTAVATDVAAAKAVALADVSAKEAKAKAFLSVNALRVIVTLIEILAVAIVIVGALLF